MGEFNVGIKDPPCKLMKIEITENISVIKPKSPRKENNKMRIMKKKTEKMVGK